MKKFWCLVFMFCVVWAGSANAAYNLTLEATTDGSTVYTEYKPGDTLWLNIGLDAGSAGVAGCAFTLVYDATKLDAPVTDPSKLPTIASSADITSIFPFKTGDNFTRCENVVAAEGKIYYSAAEITAEGGSKVHPIDVTLFSTKFTVKSGVSGDLIFKLQQTVLTNTAAGWNGESVPVVVGAVAKTDANFNDLTKAFPVMLGDTANPFTTVTLTCKVVGGITYDQWKATNGWDGTVTGKPNIGGPEDDYDHDGFTNLEEMANGTNPADLVNKDGVITNVDVTNPATWTSVGTGYNALTDTRVANLDVDGNGVAELATDGLLVIRYLFGLRGADLIADAVGTGAKRDTASLIEAYIDAVEETAFDVDGSGKPVLGEDGVILVRYLFGIRGAELIVDAYDTTYCTRCTADSIETYIKTLFPN